MMFWEKDLFRDEKGATTLGMVLAMLVTLAMVFSAAQIYRINSASAEIQEVADAAALAAENEVAEFMIAVRLCDAAVLSMTVLAVSVYGLGVVAACVPAAEAVSVKLVELGTKVIQARDSFAEKAAEGLNGLQRALPFLAAANAAGIAQANNKTGAAEAAYYAAAVLVPVDAPEIKVGVSEGASNLGSEVEGAADDLRDKAAQAERAAEVAQAAKLDGFANDCGNYDDPCMRERAESLAGLSGADNPEYSSVDAWSFSVALERARSYYAVRAREEAPLSGSVAEK